VTPAAEGAIEAVVVYGERSLDYDFGPAHPLTPRRFPPSIELLEACGARRFVAPSPASLEELHRLHAPGYTSIVEAMGADPWHPSAAGIGLGDTPPFAGMHEAAARVAGGSLTAIDAILGGEALHAFHPGGGLHHAMADRAAGFCVYNDVALAVARARDAGHRVLYVDLDVHHGDGTQALFWADPQVLTFSIHETGQSLFPGTGFISETGGPGAQGTAVNVPLQPYSGDASWLPAVREMLPALAEAFRPTFLVTQHGCDSHLFDPLAHLRVTTAAYREATALLDELAHAWCAGRWLATGGGGYDAYRVVPRSWALVWLAQAHRDPPEALPASWRERWRVEAERYDQAPLPETLIDPPGLAPVEPQAVLDVNGRTAEKSLRQALDLLGGG
jgi:acetoin utilization protein AcuC